MLKYKKTELIEYALSIIVTLLGFVVILGWHTENQSLIQVLPSFVPMQYNTALGFLITGVGLILLFYNYRHFARLAGIMVCLIGFLSLVQYIFVTDLGIDQLFMEHYITVKTSHPGRMAPNTALCFFLSGIILILMSSGITNLKKQTASELISMTILGLSIMALLGYMIKTENAYSWGNLTQMAIHTAAGFVLIAFSTLHHVWNIHYLKISSVSLWVPFSLLIAILAFDIYTPADVAAGIAYIPLVFCSIWFRPNNMPVIFASIVTMLIISGYFVSPYTNLEDTSSTAALNRFMSIAAVWIVAAIIYLQKSTQTALIQSKLETQESLRFRDLVMSNIPDLIFVKNSNFKIIQANKAFLNVYPDSIKESIIGSTTIGNYGRNTAREFLKQDRKALEEGYSETEEIIKFPDGITRTLVTKKIRFENANGEKFILGFGHDISEQKESEKALTSSSKKIEEQKNYYEFLIGYLGAPVFVLDKNHNVVLWNKACEELTGLATDDVIGTNRHWSGFYKQKRVMLADLILDNNLSKIWEMYPEHASKNKLRKDSYFIETWNDLKNGKRAYLRAVCNPIKDTEGNIVAVVEVLFDLTRLKESHIAIEKQQETLKITNKELEQFAYVASHDLQEPLRTVTSFTQLLKKRYEDKLDKPALEYIDFAVEAAKHMQKLILDLLLISRVGTEGKSFEQASINEVFDRAVKYLKTSLEEAGTVVTRDELPVVHGDSTQLFQFFQNIISNAVKYRSPERDSTIHCGVSEDENYWTLYIKDNGIGIDPAYYEKIFILFQRLHGRGIYSGTGIGLALCKKIIERHGGRIWLESTAGEGSTFFFTFPRKNISAEITLNEAI